jgi:hypothetical protein
MTDAGAEYRGLVETTVHKEWRTWHCRSFTYVNKSVACTQRRRDCELQWEPARRVPWRRHGSEEQVPPLAWRWPLYLGSAETVGFACAKRVSGDSSLAALRSQCWCSIYSAHASSAPGVGMVLQQCRRMQILRHWNM